MAKMVEEATAELLGQFGICPTENDGEAGQAAAAVGAEQAQASGEATSRNIASPRKKVRASSSPDSRPASEPGPGPSAIKRDPAGAPKTWSHGRKGGDSGGGSDSGGCRRPPATAGETSGCGARHNQLLAAEAKSAAAASAVGRTPNAAATGAAAAARSAAEAMSTLKATAAAATNPSADAGQTFQRG